ncbi:hypothetical protein EES40_30195 [Streptomyces sp. ADI93-02]|nr:hypothetical protein EES40_30195 [Streptomyces sp. ADI93-02]
MEAVADRITGLDPSVGSEAALRIADETVKATGLKTEVPSVRPPLPRRGAGAAPEAKYLVFLSSRQLDGLARLAAAGTDDITTHAPRTSASLAPAQPARARPTSARADRIRSVRWLYRRVRPATCATNVRRAQEMSSPVKRRTRSRSTTRRPATGRSAGNRR